jgi:hypothetical protein
MHVISPFKLLKMTVYNFVSADHNLGLSDVGVVNLGFLDSIVSCYQNFSHVRGLV